MEKHWEAYEKIVNECKFPECDCIVPSYAWSHEKRIPYCKITKEPDCEKVINEQEASC